MLFEAVLIYAIASQYDFVWFVGLGPMNYSSEALAKSWLNSYWRAFTLKLVKNTAGHLVEKKIILNDTNYFRFTHPKLD